MTNEEILEFYKELVEHYGDKLAVFEHHPIQFAAQVNLYKYYKQREHNEDSNLQ